MSSRQQARPTVRARSLLVLVVGLAVAGLLGAVLGSQAVTASSSSAALPGLPGGAHRAVLDGLGADDGVLEHGVSVFDDRFPAVAELDPGLLSALRQAARAAADDGVEFTVTSGWRSPEYQDRLLREAISDHGSEEEAARWVATADTSAHVSGDGVDIGPTDAMSWLSQHGDGFGLCQIYANEPWHYELRTQAVDQGCPRMYADPTEDPRMQE